MNLTLLFPRSAHPAIEERYGAWQNQLLLRRQAPTAAVLHYDRGWTGEQVADLVETDYVVVVTDPTSLPGPGLLDGLLAPLTDESLDAVVPLTNESDHPQQKGAPELPYLTLRQLEVAATAMLAKPETLVPVTWDDSDPGIFAAPVETIDLPRPIRKILSGHRVAVSGNRFLHRYTTHRGQVRPDLLERIPAGAKDVLEFGCGEGALGEALKKRQSCRVTGIEIDPEAAAVAARRLDAVLSGDATDVIYKLKQQFDTIVGGDILEHLEEPWSFLADLRQVARPDALLILSLPNIANWAVVDDLLHGRFDYTYLGILCAGHLRFFTRQSIEEMLEIAGWTTERIEPQEKVLGPRYEALVGGLRGGGLEPSTADLEPPGYYVLARNVIRP